MTAREAIQHAVRRHNAHVFGYTAMTVLSAVTLWALAYGIAYWFTLFFATIIQNGNTPIPASFRPAFLWSAAGLMVLAWLGQMANPDARPRDRKMFLELVLDVLLAIPRVTLAIWGNLSAWQRLSERELGEATHFVEEVQALRRIPLREAPRHLPDDDRREGLLFALQLVQVLEMRREDGEHWLVPTSSFDALRQDGQLAE